MVKETDKHRDPRCFDPIPEISNNFGYNVKCLYDRIQYRDNITGEVITYFQYPWTMYQVSAFDVRLDDNGIPYVVAYLDTVMY